MPSQFRTGMAMAVNTVDRRRGNAYGQVALGKIHCSRNDWLCARNCSNWEFQANPGDVDSAFKGRLKAMGPFQ